MISRERQKDEMELDLQRIKLHGNNTQGKGGKLDDKDSTTFHNSPV